MPLPRLEIDLEKISHNARTLVSRLGKRGITVTGVTKATLGSADIAGALLDAGVSDLADSRIENIEAMRHAQIPARMSLIRSPMLSQVKRVVMSADVSFNTELAVLKRLSAEAQAQQRTHGVILMIELGDLREGIMPVDLNSIVGETLKLPNIALKGIGANMACRSGASPDDINMQVLSDLATAIEARFGISIDVVSGGNSANLEWAFNSACTGQINNLRLGESILLGRETLHRHAIEGLHTDAIFLVAEVIESKIKPTMTSGCVAQSAFGEMPEPIDRGDIRQTIFALGIQDIDPRGLKPTGDTEILGCSSDHLITTSTSLDGMQIGEQMTFQLDYSALIRAMTSPFVSKLIKPVSNSAYATEKNHQGLLKKKKEHCN